MNPPELQDGIEPSDYDDTNYDFDDDEVDKDDGHNGDIDKNDENDDAYADDD